MSFPDISEIVPHSGPMLLLHRVVAHQEKRTVCEVRPQDSSLFAEADGGVPAWVGLEYMAQAVAAHGGMLAREVGAGPRQGMLLGTRRMRMAVDRFRAGQTLHVAAHRVHASDQMLSFECEIEDAESGERLAEARLSVYVAERLGTR